MGEFVAGVDGIARAARELAVPFVSGNVSLYNQSSTGRAVPASPIIACVGTMADIATSATLRFKRTGSVLYRLGSVPTSLGGSVLEDVLSDSDAGTALPEIDYAAMRAEISALLEAHERGLVLAAHDVSDGGTLVAVAEMAFASGCAIGAWLDAPLGACDAFGETGSFVVETSDPEAFEACARAHGAQASRLGTTLEEPVLRWNHERCSLADLFETWSAPLRNFYADAVAETSG
jgi:phosphoribosylformylglycinamidine synthase